MKREVKLITLAFILAVAAPAQQVSAYYQIIDLGTLGGIKSGAYSINNLGQIVGWADDSSGRQRAVLFDPTGGGNNIYLGTLGGLESIAYSINNNGQIVGQALNSLGKNRATLFDPTGRGENINLGIPPGGYGSMAFSINDNGQIVGLADDNRGNFKAALFDPTGAGNNIDLNTLIDPSLGWTLGAAHSINDNGWIVGWGRNPDGHNRAFLLIPEPASAMTLGLGGIFFALRRRRQ